MSSFYQWISKLLPRRGKKVNPNDFPQLPSSTDTDQTPMDSQEEKSYYEVVTQHYKGRGDTVWEYSKEKGVEGNHINLVIKEGRDVSLIHIKSNTHDVTVKDIQNFEEESTFFLETNPIFEHYSIKLLYVMPSLLIEEAAYKYMKSDPKFIYKIIKY